MFIKDKRQRNHFKGAVFNFVRVWYLITILFVLENCSSGNRALPLDPPVHALEVATQEAGKDPLFEYTEILSDEWWELFNDEQLTRFIKTAFARNPTLQAAQAKIYLAKAFADRARAPLFPNISWGGDILREKFSETGLIPFGATGASASLPATGGSAGIPVYFTQYETELNLMYDFDVWGKNRFTLRAAVGEMQARIADEAFVRLQLGISVAQAYFQLQIYYKRQEYAQSLVENKAKYLELVKLRVKNHLEDEQGIQTAESDLADVKQRLLNIQGNIAIQEFMVKAYLADQFEEEIYQTPIVEQPLPKVPLPIDLPLNLIGRRPDIVSQLWIIESAGNQIRVAKAGYYPDFSLTGLFGFQTIHLKELFRWRSVFFNVDPAFSLPIFDGGRLDADLDRSEINYDLAIFNYNELVLNAARDVLTGLAVLQNSEQQLQQYKKMLGNQIKLLDLTRQRVDHNLSSDLDYLTSEEHVLTSYDQEATATGNTIQAVLTLIQALGGGYENCDEEG